MNLKLLIVSTIFTAIALVGCTPTATNDLSCHPSNANVHFNMSGVSSFDGYGAIFSDGLSGYKVLGVVGFCDTTNTTDSILRIHFPAIIPDTPYTFPLVRYNDATTSEGYAYYMNYQYAYGHLTIDTITIDSLASGTFEYTGRLNSTQTWHFYNYNTNTLESFALDSICIQNGTFNNVKVY